MDFLLKNLAGVLVGALFVYVYFEFKVNSHIRSMQNRVEDLIQIIDEGGTNIDINYLKNELKKIKIRLADPDRKFSIGEVIDDEE